MRVYIDGRLSVPDKTFHLTELWFSENPYKEPTIQLSAGNDCDTCVSEDGKRFSARWKDTSIIYDDFDMGTVETKLMGIEQLKLELRNMVLFNACAFLEGNLSLTIDKVLIVSDSEEWEVDCPKEEIIFEG